MIELSSINKRMRITKSYRENKSYFILFNQYDIEDTIKKYSYFECFNTLNLDSSLIRINIFEISSKVLFLILFIGVKNIYV